jgi:NTE family protein
MVNLKKIENIKIGLALSGGSTFGIAHIGVLKALIENNISISCISGTSAGSIVASLFAFEIPIEEMIIFSKNLDWKKFSRFSYSKLGVNNNEPMSKFIENILGNVKIEEAAIPLAIVASNIETYEKVVIKEGNLTEAIRASTCIPGLFVPVLVNGNLLVDGALTENLPLTPLTEMGADFKIGVNLMSHSSKKTPKNIFDVITNSYTTLSRTRDLNIKSEADVLIEPDLSKFDFSKFDDAEKILQAGYEATIEMMPIIKEKIKAKEKKLINKGLLTKILSYFHLKFY